MAEVVDLSLEKLALPQLQGDAGLPQDGKNFVYMLYMLVHVLGEDDHVIQVYQARLPTQPRKQDIQAALKGSGRVPQTERHADVSVGAAMGDERRLILIWFVDVQLPVPAIRVQGGEDLRVAKAIDAVVHPRYWIGVRDGHGVQAAVVDTKTKGSVWLGGEYLSLIHI